MTRKRNPPWLAKVKCEECGATFLTPKALPNSCCTGCRNPYRAKAVHSLPPKMCKDGLERPRALYERVCRICSVVFRFESMVPPFYPPTMCEDCESKAPLTPKQISARVVHEERLAFLRSNGVDVDRGERISKTVWDMLFK